MLSPAQAPAAAQRMTSGSDSLPLAATTPAVMTVASLGTTGISASSIANSMTTPYAHQDASDTSWVSWSNIAVRHPPFGRSPVQPPYGTARSHCGQRRGGESQVVRTTWMFALSRTVPIARPPAKSFVPKYAFSALAATVSRVTVTFETPSRILDAATL